MILIYDTFFFYTYNMYPVDRATYDERTHPPRSHHITSLSSTKLVIIPNPCTNDHFYPGLMLVWHQPSPKSPDILVHTRATKAALRPLSRQPAPRQSRSPMYTVPPRASRTAGQVAPMPSPHQTLREPFLLVVVVLLLLVGTQHHSDVGTDSAQSIFAPARLHLQHETRAHFPP